ncbi:MAG: PQQ-binding-like beta-propeller repeat protein [Planctomycetes bacterium]|nr:PQQ-binding-like beta-propeller repeat protein [Planctomycetota bacterium]
MRSSNAIRHPFRSILVAGALALPLAPAQAQLEWPQRFRDARNSSYQPTVIDASSVEVLWFRDFGAGANLTPPLLTEHGALTTVRSQRILTALDPATGATRWALPFTATDQLTGPAYADGKVYVFAKPTSGLVRLHCIRASDGARLASPEIPSFNMPTYGLALYDGAGYFLMDHKVAAISLATGLMLWETVAYSNGRSHLPAVLGERVYAPSERTSTSVGLLAFHRTTGAALPGFQVPPPTLSPPTYPPERPPVLDGRGRAFYVDGGDLLAFDTSTGQLLWRRNGPYHFAPAVRDDVVYVGGFSDLDALSSVTGVPLWERTGSFGLSGLVVTDSHVLVTEGNYLKLFTLANGTVERSLAPLWGTCTLAAGAMLCTQESQGYLFGLRYRARPFVSSLSPVRLSAHEPTVPVTVRGSGFLSPSPTRVFFGGSEASLVQVLGDGELRCTPPTLESGFYDLRVENAQGEGALERAFAVTPSLGISAQPRIGSSMRVSLESEAGHSHLLLFGAPPAVSIPLPGYAGTLCVAVPGLLSIVAFSPAARADLDFAIPDDPALQNAPLLLQSLSGPLLGGAGITAWTNCVELVIG